MTESAEIAEEETLESFDRNEIVSQVHSGNYIVWIKRCLFSIYIMTVLASLTLIILNWIKIAGLRKRSRLTHTEAYTLAENKEIAPPFSFLRTIFIIRYQISNFFNNRFRYNSMYFIILFLNTSSS